PLMKPLDSGPDAPRSEPSAAATESPKAKPASPKQEGAGEGAPASPPAPRAETKDGAAISEVLPEFRALLGSPADDVGNVGVSWSRARALFDEWVTTPSLRRQMEAASAVMGALAKRLGKNEAAWRVIGLLHNMDY